MTPFKKFMETLRQRHHETLTSMAKNLGVSPAYVHSLESGKKAIPKYLPDKLTKLYWLTESETIELNKAIELSARSITISLVECSPEKRELAILFARVFPNLTKRQCEEIKQLIKYCQKVS